MECDWSVNVKKRFFCFCTNKYSYHSSDEFLSITLQVVTGCYHVWNACGISTLLFGWTHVNLQEGNYNTCVVFCMVELWHILRWVFNEYLLFPTYISFGTSFGVGVLCTKLWWFGFFVAMLGNMSIVTSEPEFWFAFHILGYENINEHKRAKRPY